MAIANDIMNIDFEGAADIDIGEIDDDLGLISGYNPGPSGNDSPAEAHQAANHKSSDQVTIQPKVTFI
jgi:hypothetical protein